MKKSISIAIVVLGIVGIGAVYAFVPSVQNNLFSALSRAAGTSSSMLLSQKYTNSAFRFSASYPADFKVTELKPDDTGAKTILFQNTAGEGIQVLITPHDDVKTLTAEMIAQDIPDMKISEVQTLEVGDSYKGVTFRSDNDAFGGDSREVWFIFHGNLYQISTYARLDPLLKAMFGTWKFF